MRRVVLILCGLGVGGTVLSQVDTLGALDTPKGLWTINPIALVDPFGPSSLRVGREWLLSTDLSMAAEVSGYYQYIPDRHRSQEHFQGAGVRVSSIFWLRRSVVRGNLSLSLDLGFKYTSGTAVDSVKLNGLAPYRRSYGLDRRVLTLRLCMVHLQHWTKRYWTEFYYGIGVRVKNATSDGITAEELDARDFSAGSDNDNYIVPAMHAVGELIRPEPVIGLRIGIAPR